MPLNKDQMRAYQRKRRGLGLLGLVNHAAVNHAAVNQDVNRHQELRATLARLEQQLLEEPNATE